MGNESGATATKPSRSDEVLDAEQQKKITEQVQLHFDSLAPKRPKKPNRSESTTVSDDGDRASFFSDEEIPEFHKFQSLESQNQAAILWEGKSDPACEEFVETQYYQKLNSIDKQHHSTGSGFIKVAAESVGDGGESSFRLQGVNGWRGRTVSGMRSNPATNDWIPRTDEEEAVFVSSKPARSEGSYP
ncbi:hypothetical protein H6P81_020560 [Aristolochia fimbriata]|uniref:Maternal effect embryo arrest 59 n=1 Tax=Aristolochia fimbriata TaxID=158543 RepID=A0AAV7DWK4_ARIFI|nr:hypothetical protein H6P81_020560 [Aristolochia fimbriata]